MVAPYRPTIISPVWFRLSALEAGCFGCTRTQVGPLPIPAETLLPLAYSGTRPAPICRRQRASSRATTGPTPASPRASPIGSQRATEASSFVWPWPSFNCDPRWLLGAFAGGGRLRAYDKELDQSTWENPEEFSGEVDAHSAEVETELGRIEGPAARAARTLSKRVRQLVPGVYAVVDAAAEAQFAGPAFTDAGVHHGMRLYVGRHEVPSPPPAEMRALLRFVGLMYQRSPGLEKASSRLAARTKRAANGPQ